MRRLILLAIAVVIAVVLVVAGLAACGSHAKPGRTRAHTFTAARNLLPLLSGVNGADPTNPHPGDVFTTTTGVWTGSPTSYTYQWERCDGAGNACVYVEGANNTTYTMSAADLNDTLRSVVGACNAYGCAPPTKGSTSSQTGVVATTGTAPNNAVAPSITGNTQVGATLTANVGTWTGAPTSYAYQWQDCDAAGTACSNVASGGTNSTYTVASTDAGSTLRVGVKATNAFGQSLQVFSAETGVVTSSTLGKTDVGATCSAATGTVLGLTADRERVNSYTLASAVTLNSFAIYTGGVPGGPIGSQPLEGVVYADSAGSPAALMATSTPITINNTSPLGWYTASFPSTSLPAGTYWIGIITGSPGGVASYCFDTGAANSRLLSTDTYTSGPANPFGAVSTRDANLMSLYVGYTPTSSGGGGGGGSPSPPTSPTGLTATAGDSQVALNWTGSTSPSGATIAHYNVYRAGSGSSTGCTVTATTVAQVQSDISAATDGQVVCVAAGTYGALSISHTGIATNAVLEPVVGSNPTTTGKVTFSSLTVSNSSYLTVRDFYVTGGLNGSGTNTHVTIDHNDVQNSGGYGIDFGGASVNSTFLTVSGNSVHATSTTAEGDALRFGWNDNLTVTGNDLYDIQQPCTCHTDTLQDYTNGWSTGVVVDGMTVTKNYLHDNTQMTEGFPFLKDGDFTNVKITDNLLVRQGTAGADGVANLQMCSGTSPASMVISNNTSIGTGGSAQRYDGGSTTRCPPQGTVSHNVFDQFNCSATGFCYTFAFDHNILEQSPFSYTLSSTDTVNASPAFKCGSTCGNGSGLTTAVGPNDDYELATNPNGIGIDWNPDAQSYGPANPVPGGGTGATLIAQPTARTYTDTGLTNGVSYSYYVTATDSSGLTSGQSNTVVSTPTAPAGGGGTGGGGATGGGNGTTTFDGTFSTSDPASGPHWNNAYGNCYSYVSANQLRFNITSACNPAGNGHYRTDICSAGGCNPSGSGQLYTKNSTWVCTTIPFDVITQLPNGGGNSWYQVAEMKDHTTSGGDWTMGLANGGISHYYVGFTGGAYSNTDAYTGAAPVPVGWHSGSMCQSGDGTQAQAWFDGTQLTFNKGSCSGKTTCTGLNLYQGYATQPLDINAYTGNTSGSDPYPGYDLIHGDPLIATQGSNGLPPEQPGGWKSP